MSPEILRKRMRPHRPGEWASRIVFIAVLAIVLALIVYAVIGGSPFDAGTTQ